MKLLKFFFKLTGDPRKITALDLWEILGTILLVRGSGILGNDFQFHESYFITGSIVVRLCVIARLTKRLRSK